MTIHDIGSVMLVVCALLSTTFVAGYYLTTDWKSTDVGRHLMAFSMSESAILLMYTARIIAGHDAVWFQIIRLLVFLSFPVVLAWRLVILLRYQLRPWVEERRKEQDGYLDDREGPGRVSTEEQR